MTIIDELLILLDDLDEVTSEEILSYFEGAKPQMVLSALGRLVNRGWVAKKTKRQETYYAITIHGVDQLNRTLDAIKREEQSEWDGRWRLVIFDVPETKRKLRDLFRTFLRDLGFGLMKSSVWISPWDKKEEIKRFAKRHSLNDYITLLDTDMVTDSYQNVLLAQQSWDWTALESAYKEFLGMAEHRLAELKSAGRLQRFKAKKLVFLYAEVVKKDPLLPTDIAPNASLVRRAHELYVKIRPYCLKEAEEELALKQG